MCSVVVPYAQSTLHLLYLSYILYNIFSRFFLLSLCVSLNGRRWRRETNKIKHKNSIIKLTNEKYEFVPIYLLRFFLTHFLLPVVQFPFILIHLCRFAVVENCIRFSCKKFLCETIPWHCICTDIFLNAMDVCVCFVRFHLSPTSNIQHR